jgi:uncharacterized repeat protein (TIGR01451 family)
MQGDPLSGSALFASNCSTCHGDRGAVGEDNPGSDDGTVPSLNPIDQGFLEDSKGDPTVFAADLDLFIQHGSQPAGPSPKESMPNWGDHKDLTQQQIADVEAYVMLMNGVYWPGKWYPPAEVQVDAVSSGNLVTYTINILNDGGEITGVQLQDTLPAGLSYVSSDYFGNSARVAGSTVEWLVGNVPTGGTAGPFTLVAASAGANAPSNTAQVNFSFCTWNGNCYPATAVSAPSVPGK